MHKRPKMGARGWEGEMYILVIAVWLLMFAPAFAEDGKPDLRLEWRGQGGQDETQKPDHSVSLGDSVTSSTRIGFSVVPVVNQIRTYWWCSPPRTGRQRMVPASLTARETGASFSKDKCVLISL